MTRDPHGPGPGRAASEPAAASAAIEPGTDRGAAARAGTREVDRLKHPSSVALTLAASEVGLDAWGAVSQRIAALLMHHAATCDDARCPIRNRR